MESDVNIKEGYKKTAVGVIPEEWEVMKIANLGEITGGGTPSTTNLEFWNGNINWFTPTEIKEKYTKKSIRRITELGLENSSAKLLPAGTILLTTRATIGEASISTEICTTNQGFQSIVCNESTNVLFLYELIAFNKHQLYRLANGSTFLEISGKELKKIQLPIPPLPEQKAIANCLTTWDRGIEKLSALIKAKKEQKKGLMQQLLTGEKRLDGFEGEWRKIKLEHLAEFRRGSFPQPYGLAKWYDDENGKPFIQVYDVADNFKLKRNTKRKISKLAAEKSIFVPKGTLIITIQGSIGRVAITDYEAYIDRTLLLFTEFKKKVNVYFIMLQLYRLFQIEKQRAPGGTIKTITKKVLSKFKISIPSIEEQTSIANVLVIADKEIALLEKKLERFKEQKRGLMQVLLTGERRLIENC